jgi:hypothetical protein
MGGVLPPGLMGQASAYAPVAAWLMLMTLLTSTEPPLTVIELDPLFW